MNTLGYIHKNVNENAKLQGMTAPDKLLLNLVNSHAI